MSGNVSLSGEGLSLVPGSGGGGGGIPLTVTDGGTSVANTGTISFSGATVSSGGAGIADVTITGTAGLITAVSTSFTITSGTLALVGGGAPPTGAAGGDLGGTYPNPTVLSVADVNTGTLSVAHGGTGLGAVGNSGGILGYTATGVLSASGVMAANHLMIGGGPGLTPATIGGLGNSGQPLLSAGAGNPPAFGSLNLATVGAVTGLLPFANIATIGATSLAGNATGAGAAIASIAIGAGVTLSSGTLTAGGSGGTVTNIVNQGGPFTANTTISTSGTINDSSASLTAHGIIIGEGSGAVVATAAMTNGQLLIGATGADPAPQTMSGDATISSTGSVTVSKVAGNTLSANTGAVMNNGTVQINDSTTLTGTASGTVTIAPTTGTSDVLLNLAAAGGAQTIAAAPAFIYQRCLLSIKQGATASTVTLNTGFVFGTSGGPASFTVTPTANVRDTLMLWTPDATHWVVMAVNQGITI